MGQRYSNSLTRRSLSKARNDRTYNKGGKKELAFSFSSLLSHPLLPLNRWNRSLHSQRWGVESSDAVRYP